MVVTNNPGQYTLEPVTVVHPLFQPHLDIGSCPIEGCTARLEQKGWNAPVTVYGMSSNMKAIGKVYACHGKDHKSWVATSASWWATKSPWLSSELTLPCRAVPTEDQRSDMVTRPDGLPVFTHKAAVSEELYNFITEARPRMSVGEMVKTVEGMMASSLPTSQY